jgi:hypothetical protein
MFVCLMFLKKLHWSYWGDKTRSLLERPKRIMSSTFQSICKKFPRQDKWDSFSSTWKKLMKSAQGHSLLCLFVNLIPSKKTAVLGASSFPVSVVWPYETLILTSFFNNMIYFVVPEQKIIFFCFWWSFGKVCSTNIWVSFFDFFSCYSILMLIVLPHDCLTLISF